MMILLNRLSIRCFLLKVDFSKTTKMTLNAYDEFRCLDRTTLQYFLGTYIVKLEKKELTNLIDQPRNTVVC